MKELSIIIPFALAALFTAILAKSQGGVVYFSTIRILLIVLFSFIMGGVSMAIFFKFSIKEKTPGN